MNATFRKLAAVVAIAAGLGSAAPAFAGYTYNACFPGYCPVYVPTLVCNPYGCFYQ